MRSNPASHLVSILPPGSDALLLVLACGFQAEVMLNFPHLLGKREDINEM
jgi:hypothetical protein